MHPPPQQIRLQRISTTFQTTTAELAAIDHLESQTSLAHRCKCHQRSLKPRCLLSTPCVEIAQLRAYNGPRNGSLSRPSDKEFATPPTATPSLPAPSNEMYLRGKGAYRRPFAQLMMTMYSTVRTKGPFWVQTAPNMGTRSSNRVNLEMTLLVGQE